MKTKERRKKMKRNKPRTVEFRRKRESKTNYKKRLSLLKSSKLRLVVRFSNNNIVAQLIEFNPDGDKILLGINSISLKELGWNYSFKNIPAAYLTGLKMGVMASKKSYKEAVLDTGFKVPGHKGKTYAFLKGVIDGGLDVAKGDKDIFPSEERIKGEHIKNHAELLKDNKEAYEKKFAKYLKNNLQPEKITEQFEVVKTKITS